MSNYKISALPAVVSIAGTEQMEVNQSGTSKRATVTQITAVETAARTAADAVLATSVATEATARTNADNALQTDINTRIKSDGSVIFTAAQSMGGFKLTSLGTPTTGTDAVTKTYADLKLALTGGTMSGVIAMGTSKITGLGDPILAQDAATKNYVDISAWGVAGNSPSGDTTWLGTITNHDFLLKTNNTQVGVVTKAGLFGFNKTVPVTTVDIAGQTSATNTLTLRSIGTGAGIIDTGINFLSWVNSSAANNTARFYATYDTISAGDSRVTIAPWGGASYIDTLSVKPFAVGIGTNSPSEVLEVAGNIKLTLGQVFSSKFTLSDASTITLNWNNSNVQYVVLGGSRTFTFANPKDGSVYTLIIKQDGTGSRTVTWPAAILWGGGSAPTLTTTANKVDTITLVYDGTNSKYYDLDIKLNH